MLAKRLLTAAIGIPFAMFVVNYGDLPFYFVVNLLAVLGISEMFAMFRRLGFFPSPVISFTVGLLMLAVAYKGNSEEMYFLIIALVIGSLFMLVIKNGAFSVPDAALTVLTTLYVCWLFSFFIILRNISADPVETPLGSMSKGAAYTWMALLATWANDTSAYFVGSLLGRHKLCPQISPGKTVEGAVGGLAGSIIVAMLLGPAVKIPLQHSVLLGLLTGVLAPVGDLVESVFKRYAGVKDSGKTFPGHGGILDRFDSLLFVVPAVCCYIRFFLLD